MNYLDEIQFKPWWERIAALCVPRTASLAPRQPQTHELHLGYAPSEVGVHAEETAEGIAVAARAPVPLHWFLCVLDPQGGPAYVFPPFQTPLDGARTRCWGASYSPTLLVPPDVRFAGVIGAASGEPFVPDGSTYADVADILEASMRSDIRMVFQPVVGRSAR